MASVAPIPKKALADTHYNGLGFLIGKAMDEL
jgi:hypothetical protein